MLSRKRYRGFLESFVSVPPLYRSSRNPILHSVHWEGQILWGWLWTIHKGSNQWNKSIVQSTDVEVGTGHTVHGFLYSPKARESYRTHLLWFPFHLLSTRTLLYKRLIHCCYEGYSEDYCSALRWLVLSFGFHSNEDPILLFSLLWYRSWFSYYTICLCGCSQIV